MNFKDVLNIEKPKKNKKVMSRRKIPLTKEQENKTKEIFKLTRQERKNMEG